MTDEIFDNRRAEIRLQAFGSFALFDCRHDKRIRLPTRHCEALLAYIVLAEGRTVARTELAFLLWGHKEERLALRSLSQTILSIRKVCSKFSENPLKSDGDNLSIANDCMDVDVVGFRQQAGANQLDQQKQATALYRDGLLSNLKIDSEPFDEWLRTERGKLLELALVALKRITEAEAKNGDWRGMIKYSTQLIELDPFDEAGHRWLMHGLHMLGRGNAAILHYQQYSKNLSETLDVDPEAATKALFQSIINQRISKKSSNITELPNSPIDITTVAQGRPSLRIVLFKGRAGHVVPKYFLAELTQDFAMTLSHSKYLHVTVGGQQSGISGHHPFGSYDLTCELSLVADKFEFSFRLSDQKNNDLIWLGSEECMLADVDGLVTAVATEMTKFVLSLESQRFSNPIVSHRPKSSRSRQRYYQALQFMSHYSYADLRQAGKLIAGITVNDPSFPLALSYTAALNIQMSWWKKDEKPYHEKAFPLALSGVEAAADSAYSQAVLGVAYLTQRDYRMAEGCLLYSRALPTENLQTLTTQAYLATTLGWHSEALELSNRAMALSAQPSDMIIAQHGAALFGLDMFEEALASTEAMQSKPFWIHAWLASVHGHLGNLDAAQKNWRTYQYLAPGRDIDDAGEYEPYLYDSDKQRMFDGLIKANVANC